MRKRTFVFGLALAAAAGITGIVVAAPRAKPDSTDNHADSHKQADQDKTAPVSLTPGRGRLGFAATPMAPELRTHFGAPADRGVLVEEVRPDRPAAQAGLQVGDIVLDVDGDAVHSSREIIDAIADRKKGDTVKMTVERDRHELKLEAKLVDDAAPVRHESGQLDDGTRWERFDSGNMPEEMKEMMGRMGGFGDAEESAREQALEQQIDKLEQRLDKLEHH
jgi:membrane-associated protease RseP (regulator of RpoE activity)